jgi:hypothetical protein
MANIIHAKMMSNQSSHGEFSASSEKIEPSSSDFKKPACLKADWHCIQDHFKKRILKTSSPPVAHTPAIHVNESLEVREQVSASISSLDKV